AGFFATTVPLHIALDMSWSFVQFAQALSAQVIRVKQRRTYARDAAARYPALSDLPELRDPLPWPVVVEIGALPPQHPASPHPVLHSSPARGEGEWSASDVGLPNLPLSPAWETSEAPPPRYPAP